MQPNLISEMSSKAKDSISLPLYCKFVNFRNALLGKKHRISQFEGEHIHLADDESNSIYLCRRGRHNRYKSGVLNGVNSLAKDYHLYKISIQKDGLLIDCGANIGELGLWASQQGLAYLAFEPEALEARCCDLNNFSGAAETIQKALWKENTKLEFFTKPTTADSSIFDMGQADEKKVIDAVNLDDTAQLSQKEYKGSVIFKLEAEGAEPEVLEGASKSLKDIDYVAVDCGYERGVDKNHTFVETNTFLHDHGFRLQNAAFRRVTALYKNSNRPK